MASSKTTDQRRKYLATYMANPERRAKRLARKIVQEAVRRGALVRHPCEKCGSEDRIHGHHDDYSKPMEVRWLCLPCHALLHRGERRGFCARGHEQKGWNFRISVEDGIQRRRCRKCHSEAKRRQRARAAQAGSFTH
jgi:hypothetical protein